MRSSTIWSPSAAHRLSIELRRGGVFLSLNRDPVPQNFACAEFLGRLLPSRPIVRGAASGRSAELAHGSGFSRQLSFDVCLGRRRGLPQKGRNPRSRRGLGGWGDDRGCAQAGDTVRGRKCSCQVNRGNYLNGWVI